MLKLGLSQTMVVLTMLHLVYQLLELNGLLGSQASRTFLLNE